MARTSEIAGARNAMQRHLSQEYTFQDGVFRRKNIHLFAWSQWKDARDQLEIDLKPNTAALDTDIQNLETIFRGVVTKVVELNHENKLPAFVFLRSRTNYTQKALDQRESTPVNMIGGNKQVLGTNYRPNPFNDIRKLDRHEVAVWGLLYNADLAGKLIKHKGQYLSEIVHYNTKLDTLERSVYKSLTENPYLRMRLCPSCENTRENHRLCKKEWEYKREAIRRNELRYNKWVHIPDHNVSMIPRAAQLNKEILKHWSSIPLKKNTYSVGVFD